MAGPDRGDRHLAAAAALILHGIRRGGAAGADREHTGAMATEESKLDQFGLGPEDDAHDDSGKARKGTSADHPEKDSSLNTYGLGPEDPERHS